MSFSTASPPLARALAERDYNEPTPVQAAILEAAPARDLLVSAQTGSGKTVAYGLAIAGDLLAGDVTLPRAGLPLALVIAPTRELALQVQREFEWLYEHARAKVVACVGGMDPRREAMVLASGAHIVVGTPGRLRDHIERGQLDISDLRVAVLDEADEMLDLGFREDLEFILESAPAERRSLLFSATLPAPIIQLARRYQRDALRIAVQGAERSHADIDYRVVRVNPRETEGAVVNLLRLHDAPCALVFCNTRSAVRQLEQALLGRGFPTVALSGELGQNERNAALQSLRDGRAKVCVATDVAARGIDLPGLSLVIHAELPSDPEVLQHRSGRTGRAGQKGTSVLLVPAARRRKAQMLISATGIVAEWSGPPTREMIETQDRERLLADPMLGAEVAGDVAELAQALIERHSPQAIAAAFLALRRQQLPSPVEVGDPGFPGEERRPVRERSHDPAARPPRHDHSGPRGETVWFRLGIGRKDGADPRKLLPMLCRRGHVTREDVGAIRIFDRETKVEINAEVAERFGQAVAAPDRDRIVITPVEGEPERRPARPFEKERAPRERPVREFASHEAPEDARPREGFRPAGPGKPPKGAKFQKDGGKFPKTGYPKSATARTPHAGPRADGGRGPAPKKGGKKFGRGA